MGSVTACRMSQSASTGTTRGYANIVTLEVSPVSVYTGDLVEMYGLPVGLNPCWGPVLLPFDEIEKLKRDSNTDGLPVVLYIRNNVSATILSHWTYGEALQVSPTDPVGAVHYADTTPYFAAEVDYLPWRGYTLYRHHCSP